MSRVIAACAATWLLAHHRNATAAPPTGNFELADNQTIAGWAKDPDWPYPIPVHIYVNGAFFDYTYASLSRADVGAHAFHHLHPSFGAGDQSIAVYAIGVDATGAPDGQSALLGVRTVAGSCSGLPAGSSAATWCRDMAPYWVTRQQDTKILANDRVRVGIDNSFGGTIFQLAGSNRNDNLLSEHGGSAMQLSLYGDPVPLAGSSQCDWIGPPFTATQFNPIQAIGLGCAWDSTTNDVTTSSTGPNNWTTILTNPANYNRGDVAWRGVTWRQTASLGTNYVKVTYKMTNRGQTGLTAAFQEIPALHTAAGINRRLYYRDVSANVVEVALSTADTTIPFAATRRWWSICDDSATRCVTVFVPASSPTQPTQVLAKSGLDGNGTTSNADGYAAPIGYFGLFPGEARTIVVYVFPYRFDEQGVERRILSIL